MKVQNKLRLGFGFLFIVVLFFGIISIFYVNEISNSAKIILKDNYESLKFAREMRTVLDENSLPLNAAAAAAFDSELKNEEQNLTERGEPAAVKNLSAAFNGIKTASATALQLQQDEQITRRNLRQIEVLNMNAIVRKNDKAQASVKKAVLYLGLAGTFTFLVLFSFSVNFPGFIANPLNTLLKGIREIGRNNYNKRIHFDDNSGEFAEVTSAFNEMAARLNDWENSNLSKILSQKVRIETIIEQMQDAIIGVDEAGNVLFINTSAKNLLNLQQQNLIGKPVIELAKVNDLLRSVLDTKRQEKLFKIVVDGNNTHYQLQERLILVPNLDNNHDDTFNIASRSAGKVYVLSNVTEFKALDEAKTNFIATISHELKTPISAMKLSLKLLADIRIGNLNAEQTQLVKNMDEDSDRLLKITSELLDLSQVETGNIQLNFRPTEPQEIVDYALKAVKFEAEQKNVFIQQLIPEGLPRVQADVEKTAWVLINFLSNALRYSVAKSAIIMQITLDDKLVIFSVKDFGKGIDLEYQDRLFDRYFQVPTDGQNKSGSGLGLAISRDFINAEGGNIGLESGPGLGSRFYFTLPIATEKAS